MNTQKKMIASLNVTWVSVTNPNLQKNQLPMNPFILVRFSGGSIVTAFICSLEKSMN